MGRDEDYDERRDRERHEEYTRQMYEDWDRSDNSRREGLLSALERDRKGVAMTGASAQPLTTIASAKSKAREVAIDPALSEEDREFLSLMWEQVAVARELDSLGNPTQGLEYARAQGLKAQLDELKQQARAIAGPPIMNWPLGTKNKD